MKPIIHARPPPTFVPNFYTSIIFKIFFKKVIDNGARKEYTIFMVESCDGYHFLQPCTQSICYTCTNFT